MVSLSAALMLLTVALPALSVPADLESRNSTELESRNGNNIYVCTNGYPFLLFQSFPTLTLLAATGTGNAGCSIPSGTRVTRGLSLVFRDLARGVLLLVSAVTLWRRFLLILI